MSEVKHTPGPWEFGFGDGVYGPRAAPTCYLDGNGFLQIPIRVGKNPVAWILSSRPDGHEDADARLIAAAPELLEALRELLDEHVRTLPYAYGTDDDPEDSAIVRFGRAAIAKATGEQA